MQKPTEEPEKLVFSYDETSNKSHQNFLYNRMNDQLAHYIKKSIFKNVKCFYEFMNLTEIYLFGSFALSVLSPTRIYKSKFELDFYIKVKTERDIKTIICSIMDYFLSKPECESISVKLKNKNLESCYQFAFNQQKVYELSIYDALNSDGCYYYIDLVFGYEDVDNIFVTTDFTILKNYIYASQFENKFIYNTFHFQDILNCELNVPQQYINILSSIEDTNTINNIGYKYY